MPSTLQNEVDLPAIDLSQFPFEFEGLKNLPNHRGLDTVRDACTEWGFFRVLNTGISKDVFQSIENVGYELCAMPPEVKDRTITSVPLESYARTPSHESFWFPSSPHSDSVLALCDKMWPGKGNPNLCNTIAAYASGLVDLQRKISIIILASLGLDVEMFYHSDFEKNTSYMRISHYNSSEKSKEEEEEKEEALFPHTDIGCFTILYQDNNGGLQIRSKQGKWLNVNPVPNSFVVNIADCLKAWSNGRYGSAEHRVVYNGWMNRISVPWFVHFPHDKQIWAPEEFVDDDHPRCYRPFIISEFKQLAVTNFTSKKENLTTFLDSYAGLPNALDNSIK